MAPTKPTGPRPADGRWHCPRCGAGFVNKNNWHSCGVFSVDDLFRGRHNARPLYVAFLRFARRVGEFEVIPQKTRISFLAKTRWGGVQRVGKAFLVVAFGLPRRVASPRIQKVERVLRWYVHSVRISDASDLDAELEAWLRESYEQMGLRRYLGR